MESARDSQEIEHAISNINKLGRPYSEKDRGDLLLEAKALVRALETTQETVYRMAWVEPVNHAVIRVAIDLNIFVILAESSTGNKALTSADIASKAGAEHGLVIRILNHLSAIKVVSQPGPDLYKPNELSTALTKPERRDAIPWIQEGVQPGLHILPQFLKDAGWKDTTDSRKAPFQKSFNTDLHMFDYLKQHDPVLDQKYRNMLAGHGMGRVYWTDAYPVREQIGENDGDVLFVDMGGNLGRDATMFRERFPDLKGRVVSQDLEAVVKTADKAEAEKKGVELMAHDFFTEQPIKGAKYYFMHFVLHDWANEDCIRILARIREAMKPGYSKLIINELVIPSDPQYLHEIATALDWILLAAHSAHTRTQQEWRNLVEEAGFEWTGFWAGSGGNESVIQAEVKT